jgi:hypothetical protein
LIIKSI